MTQIHSISKVMTSTPITVTPDAKLSHAKHLMEKHRIRHLPVTAGKEIVGMINDRDLRLAGAYRFPESLRVFDLMKEHPYCIAPDAPVGEALRMMAEMKYEAIAVTSGRRTLLGIFTRHNALTLINQVMQETDAPRRAA